MARVDPPNPVHTRPYGPARRSGSVILRYVGPLAADQAEAARDRIRSAVPDLDVLLVDQRWTVAYPPATTEGPTP